MMVKTLFSVNSYSSEDDIEIYEEIIGGLYPESFEWQKKLINWAKKKDIEIFDNISIHNFNKIQKLSLLDLSACSDDFKKLTKLPKEICNFNNLKILEIGSVDYSEMMICNLDELPKFICKMVNLRELHLQYQNIKSLPVEIKNLKNLRVLKLGGNKLKSLPKEIGELANLEILTFWSNQIEELPIEIIQLVNLKGLSIIDNPFEKNNNLRYVFKKWLENLKKNGCKIESTIEIY